MFETLVPDIVDTKQRYLAPVVSVPTSSAVVLSVNAFQYHPLDAPVTSSSTSYFVTGTKSVSGSTA